MGKVGKILGSVSPMYGLASGEGLFGNLRKISPFMHAIGETDTADEKRRKAAKAAKADNVAPKAGVEAGEGMKRGGKVKKMAKGGSTASKRADGCATKGKTKGRFV